MCSIFSNFTIKAVGYWLLALGYWLLYVMLNLFQHLFAEKNKEGSR